MKVTRLVLLLAMILWWAVYFRTDGSWIALVAALAFTASWVVFEVNYAVNVVNYMIKAEDPIERQDDDPR